MQRSLRVQADSSVQSLINYHFANLSLPSLVVNTGVLYTVGNYHLLKYGRSHFFRVLGVSCFTGSLLSAVTVYNDRSF